MRFRNDTPHNLTFEINRSYMVDAGSEVEIPDQVAYCVKKYGLPLTPLVLPVDGDTPEVLDHPAVEPPAVESPKVESPKVEPPKAKDRFGRAKG